MAQLDNSAIKNWKSITHNFDDPTIWQERLECLDIENDNGFSVYLESLKNEAFNNKEIFFLESLLSCKIDSKNKADYISVYIAKELSECIKSSFESSKRLKKLNIGGLFPDISTQLEEKIAKFISPIINYEFEVYQKAFKEDIIEFSQFINEITYLKEWQSYFFESYPVLLKLLGELTNNLKTCLKQFIQRLNDDFEEIKETYNFINITAIQKLSLFLGDSHKLGQTTIAIWLQNSIDEPFCLYYKPRSLSPDIYWNNIMFFLQQLGLDKGQHLTRNIEKIDYGWQLGLECCNHFKSESELQSFFYNQGINASLAYFFNVQDLIADNIAIVNNYPSFFDLEMFFCPQNPIGDDYRTKSSAGAAYLLSVIKTGMIPSFGFETANHIGYSNSGVSHVSGKKNLPIFDNKIVKITNYCNYFESGFKRACYFFIEHKEQIIVHLRSMKEGLSKMQTRVLIRLTFTYSQLLEEAHSPIYMSDNVEYKKLFDFLWRGYDKKIVPPKIIQNEIQQLVQGDIPYFSSNPLSRNLYDYKGNIIVPNYFEQSGYDVVLKKIQKINPQIIREQTNIIRRSFYIHENSNLPVEFEFPNPIYSNSECLFSKIEGIASFMYGLSSFKDDTYFAYTDYIISKEDIWTQGIQNIDMFQGIEGIGLFLTAYYSISKDQHALSIASQIFNQSIEYLKSNQNILLDNNKIKIGIVNFPISTIYYSILGNQILGKNYFYIDDDSLTFILKYIDLKFQHDEHYCYFSGTTGAVLLFMKFYEKHPIPELLYIIEKLGNYLISSSIELNGSMISWRRRVFDKWGGFAHGNSSTSYALFKLADLLKKSYFYEKAIKSLTYDQNLFNFKYKKWDKSIDFEGDTHHSWGNGSAGIGLSRFLISPYYNNEFMEYEMKIAKENIDKELPKIKYADHSVCSGLLGMLEIRCILDPGYEYKHTLEEIFSKIKISELQCGGWDRNPLVTGLFYGYAGIGYNLIKLLYNKNIPSLLWI